MGHLKKESISRRCENLCESRQVPNARHHPRPHSTIMKGSVEGRRVHAVVRSLLGRALVLCGIRTRYTADPELCNNATPYRRAKTTTYSGSLVVGPRDSGIIMQQSPRKPGLNRYGQ